MIQPHKEGIAVSLHILPNAPKTEFIGVHNNCLKIKIKAPPIDGKANQEIINFFKVWLGCSKKDLALIGGEKSKQKKLLIRGWKVEDLQNHLSHNSS